MFKKNYRKIEVLQLLLWVLYFVGILTSTLVFAYLGMLRYNFGLLNLQPFWLYPYLIASLGVIVLQSYALVLTTRFLNHMETLSRTSVRKKILLIAVGIVSIMAIGLLSSVILNLFHEKPPKFFPFDDPNASYTIVKMGENYMLKYDSAGDANAREICEFIDNGTLICRTEVARDIQVMIGESAWPLDQFLNQQVEIDGDFTYSDQQCVASECRSFGGTRWAVLNLKSIDSNTSR